MTRGGFVSHSRIAGMAEADARRAWLLLLSKGRGLANRVRDGEGPDRIERAEFAGLVIRHRAALPLPILSARAGAEALLALLKGFVEAGYPPAMAGFVLAGIDFVEAALIAHGHAQAEADRRRIGEVD